MDEYLHHETLQLTELLATYVAGLPRYVLENAILTEQLIKSYQDSIIDVILFPERFDAE